jgi:3-methyladenine DNA glycosylase/8-oxoguanine DNA glycosylase
MEILDAAKTGQKPPPGWTLPALAVAIAASRSIMAQNKTIEALQKRVEKLEGKPGLSFEAFDKAFDEPIFEPDPEALEDSYKERLRNARATADKGAGWAKVVEFAYAGTSKSAPLLVCMGSRPPTDPELRVIETWLNRNATRGTSL